MGDEITNLEKEYAMKCRQLEDTLNSEQKELLYELEILKEKLDNIKEPA